MGKLCERRRGVPLPGPEPKGMRAAAFGVRAGFVCLTCRGLPSGAVRCDAGYVLVAEVRATWGLGVWGVQADYGWEMRVAGTRAQVR